jgi:HK97 family phage major capsid protein
MTRFKPKLATLVASLGAVLHGAVFNHMARHGLIACLDTPPDPAGVRAELKRIGDEVKAAGEKALNEVKAFGKMTEETKAAVDKLLSNEGEVMSRLSAAEQLMAKIEANGAGGDVQHETLGQQFVNSEHVKTFLARSKTERVRGRVDLVVNALITSLTTNADGSAGDLIGQPTRVPGVFEIPQRRLTVRDLISPGRMDGDMIEYVKETGFTNNAGMVPEGTRKPESTIKFDKIATTPKVIAHYMKASRQILSDAAQLASIIDQRLRYGLALKEEDQLLNGDGTGENLLGIIPQATAYVAPAALPAGVTATAIDTIRLAMLQSELAEFPSTGTVMHPVDWTLIELLKDDLGRYIIGNPQGGIAPTLWNRPVVTTKSIVQDKFLTGAFRPSAQVFDRWVARVEVATENEDDFVKNLVTVLAEERLALAVYRPEGFIYGDMGRLA